MAAAVVGELAEAAEAPSLAVTRVVTREVIQAVEVEHREMAEAAAGVLGTRDDDAARSSHALE